MSHLALDYAALLALLMLVFALGLHALVTATTGLQMALRSLALVAAGGCIGWLWPEQPTQADSSQSIYQPAQENHRRERF